MCKGHWGSLIGTSPHCHLVTRSLRKCACIHGEHGNDKQRATGGQIKFPYYSVAQIWRIIPKPKRALIERARDSKDPGSWTAVWLLGSTLEGPAWISTKRPAGMRTSQWVAAWRADGPGCVLPLGPWHYSRSPPALWHLSAKELANINFFYSKTRMRGEESRHDWTKVSTHWPDGGFIVEISFCVENSSYASCTPELVKWSLYPLHTYISQFRKKKNLSKTWQSGPWNILTSYNPWQII